MPMDCSIRRRQKKDEQLKLLLENDSDHLKEAIHRHTHPDIGLNVNEKNECLNDEDDSSKKVVRKYYKIEFIEFIIENFVQIFYSCH